MTADEIFFCGFLEEVFERELPVADRDYMEESPLPVEIFTEQIAPLPEHEAPENQVPVTTQETESGGAASEENDSVEQMSGHEPI